MKQLGKTAAMLVCFMAIFVALALLTQAASAKPGELDLSFGQRGRAMAATAPQTAEFPELGAGMAWAGHGRIVIAGSHTVVEYLPNGRPNRGFGRGGRLTIHSPSGIRFLLQAIAVDSQGRLLIAGTSKPIPELNTPGPREFPGPPPAWATVTRYLPNGKRDGSFGNNGTVNSTLGLPSPKPNSGFDITAPPFQYQTPAVEVTGIAVDSQDRAVLTGVFVDHVTFCYPGFAVGWHGSYLARLTTSGAMDPSFHESGLLQIPEVADASRPTLTLADHRILYTSLKSTQCVRGDPAGPAALNALNEDGQPDTGFGANGYMGIDQPKPTAIAVDRRGSVFLTGPVQVSSEYDEEPEFRVARISPSGTMSASFAAIPHWISAEAIAIDGRGRILLAGSATTDPPKRSRFVLARMKSSGKPDRSFGHHGSVKTGFGRRVFADATQILLDPQGRIVVGGIVFSNPSPSTGNGVAVVRYLSK